MSGDPQEYGSLTRAGVTQNSSHITEKAHPPHQWRATAPDLQLNRPPISLLRATFPYRGPALLATGASPTCLLLLQSWGGASENLLVSTFSDL